VDKRSEGRAKKRVMVKYGIEKTDRTAFTKNISETGLCLKTNHVFKPGSTVQIELHMPDRTFSMWGRVAWAKKVPPNLAHVLDCGMGLSFVDPSPEWLEYYESWKES
jgi:Tfp pilus assembly protein PilZ